MKEALIVRAKRTPIGRQNGVFKTKTVEELTAPLLYELSRCVPGTIDEVILAHTIGPGGNLARLSLLQGGLSPSIPGLTLDRQCGGGLEAIRLSAALIKSGSGTCYLAGGSESTSTSSYKKRARFSPDEIGDPDMGLAAEYVAQKYGITRAKQDEYARISYTRTYEALQNGSLKEEIFPLFGIDRDEALTRKPPSERLFSRAAPSFLHDGTVTAANCAGISDGSCVTVVMEGERAKELNMYRGLKILGTASIGVHPHFPGEAPIKAIRKLLDEQNLTVHDIDLFEINEAFSSKVVACARELHIPLERLNVRGGAIALGHPYGASGAMLATRLFYEGQKRDARYAIASAGIAGGLGLSILFEVIK